LENLGPLWDAGFSGKQNPERKLHSGHKPVQLH
jgi:hypothetical protein